MGRITKQTNAGTNLCRCSRCKCTYYCDAKCQRKNWDLHQHLCEQHEIADTVEAGGDEKLAEWMRTKNRKIGVVTRGDQKVEYGKLPRPERLPTKEELEEEARLKRERESKTFAQRQTEEYAAFKVTDGFGLVADKFKWSQTQHNVTIVVPLAEGVSGKDLRVVIGPERISVRAKADDAVIIEGDLEKPIKAEESSWQVDKASGILGLSLLKRWRSGNYAAGTTNADTWWPSLFKDGPKIPLKYPPTEYYSAPITDAP